MLLGGRQVVLRGKLELSLPPFLQKAPRGRLSQAIRTRLHHHDAIVVGVAAGLVSLLSFLYFYQANLITALADSRSRLLLARHVVDGIDTGPAQLGAVWLPLPQILMTSMIWNNFLYQSGIAGAAVSMCAFIAASVFLYKLVTLVGHSRLAGAVAILFFSGPNILYLQSTPMSEVPFIALWLGSIYFFVRWTQDPHGIKYLVLTAFMLLLASLTRYEGWILLGTVTVAMIYTFWLNRFSYDKAEGYLVFFATLAFAGIAFWLLWNQVIFGDVLYFARSQYSAQTQGLVLNSGLSIAQRTAGNLALSTAIYGLTALESVGWISALVAVFGLVYWLSAKIPAPTKLAALLLLFPLPFYIFSMWNHSVTIQNPFFTPGVYLNASYGVLMVPATAFFAGYLVSRWHRIGRLAVPSLALVSILVMMAAGPLDLSEARSVVADPGIQSQVQAGQWLHSHYSGGLVLRQRFGNEASSFASQVPLIDVVYEGDPLPWRQSLQGPSSQNIDWIFMRETVGSTGQSDQVWQALHDSLELQANYYLAYQQGGIEIYVRNPPGGTPVPQGSGA